jgi:hypothetical protein
MSEAKDDKEGFILMMLSSGLEGEPSQIIEQIQYMRHDLGICSAEDIKHDKKCICFCRGCVAKSECKPCCMR